jgi:signal transduction histidine kinase/CheY-like chemotaxis protein
MIGCAAVAVVLALVSLRWIKNTGLVGNLIAAAIFCLMIGLAVVSGGIQAASVMWLPTVVIIALVLCGTRAGIAWAVASCLGCLGLLCLPAMGVDPTNDIPMEKQSVLDFAATCGIVLCAFSLTFLFKTSEAKTRQALVIARDQSDHANRAKSTFLANMSHEIRTPLNAVLGMSELMQDTPLSRQQQEYMEIAQDSGKALLALVDDILDFSRIEAGKLVLAQQRFDVHTSLLRTLKALAVPAHTQGLELVCHIEPSVPRYVVGDSGRLRQIVMNLVGNAIKFTEHGEVVLRVRLEDQTEDTTRLHFATTDTGIGIPEDRQEAIFRLFEQADMSSTRRFGGVGLGLAITSHLVQAMGGKIDVTSEVARGSSFEFTASFARTAQDAKPVPVTVDGQRVLLVEDQATTRQVLEEMLGGWGIKTQVAIQAGEAVDLVTQAQTSGEPFDLVLVDSLLGDSRGCELAEEVQQTIAWKGRILMMLTCDRLPESVARCEQLGIHDYLVKPIGQWELLEALQSAGIRTSRPERPSCPEEKSGGRRVSCRSCSRKIAWSTRSWRRR